MARAAENKLLAQRSQTKPNPPPPTLQPKPKKHGTTGQYDNAECPRCGKRHPGAAKDCWARWHKDGTQLPPVPSGNKPDKLKVKALRHAQGHHQGRFDRPDNRRPTKHREDYSDNEDSPYSTGDEDQ
jgi:hypothetical protein